MVSQTDHSQRSLWRRQESWWGPLTCWLQPSIMSDRRARVASHPAATPTMCPARYHGHEFMYTSTDSAGLSFDLD